jgi:hypothetical protein
MCVYMGNVGHLLPHWVLCEILSTPGDRVKQVAFVDAHSMSPFANRRKREDDIFDLVRLRLPGEGTPYERAWHSFSKFAPAYPNSAAFLTAVWPGLFSLLLCEIDSTVAKHLQTWAQNVKRESPQCVSTEVAGDWRDRFRRGLLLSGDLAFFSFDPCKFDRHEPSRKIPGDVYPSDLECFTASVQPMSQGVIVQLSTYSARNDNLQQDVIELVHSRLKDSGFEIVASVHANDNMMSMVLSRNIAWADSLRSMESRFKSWLDRVKQNPASTR